MKPARFAVVLFALVVSLAAWADERDSRDAMISTLGSRDPNPALGAEARTFDRLIGTWDTDFGFHTADGAFKHKRGQVIFGWVLDGRAVQDLWITYPEAGEKERRIGTSFRFFDTEMKRWRVTFINPQFNYVVSVDGNAVGDRIVLGGVDKDGAKIRWTFQDITPTSFVWHGETSKDGGKTWVLQEEHHMTKAEPRSAAVFKQLTSVVGNWEGVQDGTPISVVYTLMGNGSALMEQVQPGNPESMITMFTVDGDRMIATHYCAARNQPEMATKSVGDLTSGVTFALEQVTGMKTPDDWHNTGLTLTLDDADHMTQRWTYLYKGKAGTTTFHYARKK